MPYDSNEALPERVRDHLPRHAQGIFRKTFNRAWASYADREPAREEEIANRVAWAAVKKRYHRAGATWIADGDDE